MKKKQYEIFRLFKLRQVKNVRQVITTEKYKLCNNVYTRTQFEKNVLLLA